MLNTLNKGSVRTITFKEGDTWYGVALEFNLVTEGDTPEMASYNLQEAIIGYVESLRNTNVGGIRVDGILNQEADPEYEELWKLLEAQKPIPSPYQEIFNFGRQLLNK